MSEYDRTELPPVPSSRPPEPPPVPEWKEPVIVLCYCTDFYHPLQTVKMDQKYGKNGNLRGNIWVYNKIFANNDRNKLIFFTQSVLSSN